MDIMTAILIGLALSADCFAIAVAITSMRRIRTIEHVKIPFHFGLFHFIQMMVGYFLGSAFESIISSYDHWIAFLLLSFIGGRIIYHAAKEGAEKVKVTGEKDLLLLSFASSIDALILGIALSMMDGGVIFGAAVISITVFAASLLGLEVGERINRLEIKYVEIIGGLVLIGIGVKTLIGHLWF